MRKDLEEICIKSMCEDYTKEQLAEMIMNRDDRICEFKAWVNQIMAGDSGIVFYDTIEYLKNNKQFELADKLDDVKSYLIRGNKFLND